ncbi:MAG TPA: hydroxymethylbilane synthase [Propionibacteriaceae bacterium]|nr:hydroxymethylbilane synthase [Propionibacteriaceae bacterium]
MPTVSDTRPIRLGARTSALARAQASQVATALGHGGIGTTFVGITTAGDLDQRQLTEIGGTGVFVSAVRDALRRGEIDVAVHSLKDLPTTPADDLEIIAIPVREDTRDVLVGRRLDDLSDGARVGTGAPRRAMQILDWAAGGNLRLEVMPIRGNVETRIERVREGKIDAVILAAAGLRRLSLLPEMDAVTDDVVVKQLPAQILDHRVMLPAPGQGALALEIHRSLSIELRERLAVLDNSVARAESLVERGFLAALEAGCTAPVGAHAEVTAVRGTSLDLTLTAVIGRTLLSNLSEPTKAGPVLRLEAHGSSDDPEQFGVAHAGAVLAQLREQNV